MTARVLRAQQTLRRLVDDRAWAAYLDLENEINTRASKQMRLLFKRMLAVYTAANR